MSDDSAGSVLSGEPTPASAGGEADRQPAPTAEAGAATDTSTSEQPNGQAAPQQTPPAWWRTHSEGFEKSEATTWQNFASRYTTPQEFAKAHIEMRKTAVFLPKEDDKDKDAKYAQVYEKLGWPKEATAYKFMDKYEGVELDDTDKSYREGFRGIAHRTRLTQSQVTELEKWQAEQAKLAKDAQMAARTHAPEKAKKALKGEWGDQLDRNLNNANTAVIHYGGKASRDIVNITLHDGSTLGSHPEFIKMMARIGAERAEDDREPTAFNSDARESAQQEINRIEEEARSKGLLPTSPGYPHKELDALYRKAYGSKPLGTMPIMGGPKW